MLGASIIILVASFSYGLSTVIPTNYDSGVKPSGNNKDDPLSIIFNIHINEIQKVDTEDMSLTLSMYLRVVWHDNQLNYPKEKSSNKTSMNLNSVLLSDLWVPDHFFKRMRQITGFRLLQEVKGLKFHKNLTVHTSTMLKLEVGCPMNFKSFPFDEQICLISLASYFYDKDDVRFEWSSRGLSVDEEAISQSANYEVTIIPINRTLCKCKGCLHDEPCIQFTVVLKRYYLGHILGFFIPSTLFIGISWISFFWPSDVVPGRTVLVITSLLAASGLYADSRQNSPKTSYVKALDAWMFFSIIITVLTLFQYAVVLQWISKSKKDKPMSVKPLNQPTNPSETTNYKAYEYTTEKVGRYGVPLLFISFNCAYWPYVLNYKFMK